MTVFTSEGSRKLAHQLDDLMERWKLRHEGDEVYENRIAKIATIDNVKPIVELEKFIVTQTIVSTLEKMNYDDLGKLLLESHQKGREIKAQMNEFTRSRGGDPNKNKWFVHAKYIMSCYGSLSQAVQAEMGKKHKSERKTTFTVVFIDVAEEMLDKETFSSVKAEADRRFKEIQRDEQARLGQ